MKKQQSAVLTAQTRRRRVKNTILGLVAGLTAALVGCFTGDDLVDQPCQVDADCNALADALGERLTCRHNVCGYTTRCGDGIVDESEKCDNGPLNVDSDYGQRAGDCSATTCTFLPFCGDKIVQNSIETCDDGNTDNSDSCLNTCAQAFCGDGFVGPGEACDPKAEENCTEDCAFPNCGDGRVNGLEECDDGNDDDTDSCLNLCLKASCGDGILWAGVESCDDGNKNNADACLDTCEEASCGDGYTQLGVEECDDGNGDSTDDCLATCKLATCGDNIVHGMNETCDDGNDDNNDSCTVLCQSKDCGDGVPSEPEQCDDGNKENGDGCSSICKYENCGDSVIQPPEECDDGNDKNDDECVYCSHAKCGDATVWKNHEQCDDGNDLNTDACVNCNLAVCGDGFAWEGQEECDDGNDDNTDACLNTCVEATCGDGFVHEGSEEECDDGNDIDDDACRNNCKENYCGDTVVDPDSEGCDDGNEDTNDGCHNCKMGAEQIDTSLSESRHVCAVRDAKVRCWGKNATGNLGYGTTANLGDDVGDMPHMSAVNVGGNVKKIVTGGSDDNVSKGYTCVLLEDEKSVYCWGYHSYLGYANNINNIGDNPGEMPPLASNQVDLKNKTVKDIDAGSTVACALTMDGEVYCWGESLSGQLGKSGVTEAPTPGDPINISGNSKVVQISVGLKHTCAVLEDKSLRCWGYNQNGQLGYGNTTKVDEPSELEPVDLGQNEVKQVSAGWRHTCVLFETNRVRCWGFGNLGQLGNWDNEVIGDNEEPSSSSYNAWVLTPDDTPIRSIHAGYNNTCALLDNGGVVKCWGGASLVPGPGHIGDSPNELAQTISLGGSAQSLTMGQGFICALMNGGAVRCWGENESGQLGLNHTTSVEVQLNDLPPPPEDAKVYPNP